MIVNVYNNREECEMRKRCECEDSLCPVHVGKSCAERAQLTLFRVDMEDRTGVRFCDACGTDALESDVFSVDSGQR